MESEILIIEEASNTLEDANNLVSSKVPVDFEIIKREIISEGKPERIIQTASTQAAAQEKALALLPAEARDVQIALTPEKIVNEQLEALNEVGAKNYSRQLHLPGAELLQMTLLKPGRKQFLMVKALPGLYNLEVRLPAKCEVTFTPQARVRIRARLATRSRIMEILNSPGSQDEKKSQIRRLLEDRKIVDKIGQLTNYRRGGTSFLWWCDCGYPKVPSLLDFQSHKQQSNDIDSYRYNCPQCHAYAMEENLD